MAKSKKKSASFVIEICESAFEGRYDVWMKGFGNPSCSIAASNVGEAKKIVGEYVFNELCGKDLLDE